MKLSALVAIAAVIGGSFLIPMSAEAESGIYFNSPLLSEVFDEWVNDPDSTKVASICKSKLNKAYQNKKVTICDYFAAVGTAENLSQNGMLGKPVNTVAALNSRMQEALDEWTDPVKLAEAEAHNSLVEKQNKIDASNASNTASGCPSGQGMATWKSKKMGCMTPSQYELWSAQMKAAQRANRNTWTVPNNNTYAIQNLQNQLHQQQLNNSHQHWRTRNGYGY